MSDLAERRDPPRFVAVRRKRRPFGLDAPKPRDRRRIEADIRAWIDTRVPAALVLRLGGDTETEAALVVLLPGCRVVVLGIESATSGTGKGQRLAEDCRSRGIALTRVSSVEEARAALRRLGVEPEEV